MYFFSTITLLVMGFLYSTTTAVPLDLNTPLITRGQNGKCSIDWTLTEFLPRPSDGRRSTISADLFDGYAPIDRNTRPRMQNMKWLGSEGLPGASTTDAVELNEHAVFIHDINGDNIMMIMWKMSPDNPDNSEWLDFYYGPPAADLVRWKDLDRNVGHAGCEKGFWIGGDGKRQRQGSCWWKC